MAAGKRTPAYFAVARTIFEHPLFNYGRHPYSRREAWEWLIAQAAYKPKGHRHVLGVVDLQRGQLSATVREMAAAWRWPRSNVHRFLRRLATEGMVALARDQSGTTNGAQRGLSTRWRTIVSICNYDKFQYASKKRDYGRDYERDYDAPKLPGIIEENAAETKQTLESVEREAASTTRGRSKPKHGQRAPSKDGQIVWVDHGTQEWEIHAKDYQEVRNIAILPKTYQGGRGNWFMVHGEQTRKGRVFKGAAAQRSAAAGR